MSVKDQKTIKRITVILRVSLLIVGFIGIIILSRYHNLRKAEQYVEKQEYDNALCVLESSGHCGYGRELEAYCRAMIAVQEGKTPDKVFNALHEIDLTSKGRFMAEIKESYELYQIESANYEREQEALKKAAEEQAEQLLLTRLSNSLPYEGLDSKYVNSTMVGQCDEYEHHLETGKRHNTYFETFKWYSNDGKHIVLIVDALDYEVTDVIKYYEDKYWTKDGLPNFGATKNCNNTYSSGLFINPYSSGNYDVDDYDTPDDFADDAWGDDFEDWDDAYNFWEANN